MISKHSGIPLSEGLRCQKTPHFEHIFSATREFSIVLNRVKTLISENLTNQTLFLVNSKLKTF